MLASSHPESAEWSGLSLRGLFYHCPADGIMYHKRRVRSSFRDENTCSIRVIMDLGTVRERQVKMAHIGQPRLPAPNHDVLWNTMSACARPASDALKRRFRRRQPKKEKRHTPAARLTVAKPRDIRAARAGRLESKALTAAFIRSIISRPAATAACSALYGESPRAISSALTNSRMLSPRGTSRRAVVVFPAPLGSPMMRMSFNGCGSLRPKNQSAQ